ncbi:MAG: MmgE/PrpD family protein [Gammaproteobacteria bacterium]|nr:MmgE/PrpD family protein [Gammaproteobacteria bacterium]
MSEVSDRSKVNNESEQSVAQLLGAWGASLDPTNLSEVSLAKNRDILIDIIGLCIAARNKDYVKAVIEASEPGDFTILGHAKCVSVSSAALVNGTAAHGEDFDDTFEGGPVHSGVVMVPAMLAAAERYQLNSADLMLGLVAGNELLCRLALTLPKAIHKSGFHPTAVLGSFAATFGIAVACRSESKVIANALGIAGSMASGIIEYLGDGSWTKRMHPGWAAQSGLRAFAMAKAGFAGPRYVFEGEHGVFKVFASSVKPKLDCLFDGLGEEYVSNTISFKPYPCGTMIQPYIDCARQLREQGINVGEIESILCETAEGYVHRLWEPLVIKRSPPTSYAAKFSVPYGVALGLIRGHADLDDYSEDSIADPDILTLAAKINYQIDPANPYPQTFTGHVRVLFKDGSHKEVRQGFMRGGRDAPLSQKEITEKFYANCKYGGHSDPDKILNICKSIGSMQDDYLLIQKIGEA